MKNTLLGRARPLAVRSVGLSCMGDRKSVV